MPRIDLPDGQWAELHDRITHADDNAIKGLVRKSDADETLWFAVDDAIMRAFVREWNVRDRDGNPIALADADAIDRLPADVADAIITETSRKYAEATRPNVPTPPSSDG